MKKLIISIFVLQTFFAYSDNFIGNRSKSIDFVGNREYSIQVIIKNNKPPKRKNLYKIANNNTGSKLIEKELQNADNLFDENKFSIAANIYKKNLKYLDEEQNFRLGYIYAINNNFEMATKYFSKSTKNEAKLFLAAAYINGLGVEINYIKAHSLVENLASNGDNDAMLTMGLIYARVESPLKDKNKSIYWFEKSGYAGNQDAMIILGKSYYNDGFSIDNDRKAIFWLEKAALLNNHDAICALINVYLEPSDFMKGPNPLAEYWLKILSEKGDINAMLKLSILNFEKETKEGEDMCKYLIDKAIQKKSADAIAYLAYFNFIKNNDCKAYKNSLENCISQKSAAGFALKGIMMYNGEFCSSIDYTNAFINIKKAAELGFKEAMELLSDMYKDGEGTSIDKNKAKYWEDKFNDTPEFISSF
jgi:TPR repeat protein